MAGGGIRLAYAKCGAVTRNVCVSTLTSCVCVNTVLCSQPSRVGAVHMIHAHA